MKAKSLGTCAQSILSSLLMILFSVSLSLPAKAVTPPVFSRLQKLCRIVLGIPKQDTAFIEQQNREPSVIEQRKQEPTAVAIPQAKPVAAIPTWTFPERPNAATDLEWDPRYFDRRGRQEGKTFYVDKLEKMLPPELPSWLRTLILVNRQLFHVKSSAQDPQRLNIKIHTQSKRLDEFGREKTYPLLIQFDLTPRGIIVETKGEEKNVLWWRLKNEKTNFSKQKGERYFVKSEDLLIMLQFVQKSIQIYIRIMYPLLSADKVNHQGRFILEDVEVDADRISSPMTLFGDLKIAVILDAKGARRYFLPGVDEINRAWGLDQPGSTMKFKAQRLQEGTDYHRSLADGEVLVNVSNGWGGTNLTAHDYFSHLKGYQVLNEMGLFAPASASMRALYRIEDSPTRNEVDRQTARRLRINIADALENVTTNLSDLDGVDPLDSRYWTYKRSANSNLDLLSSSVRRAKEFTDLTSAPGN